MTNDKKKSNKDTPQERPQTSANGKEAAQGLIGRVSPKKLKEAVSDTEEVEEENRG